MGGAGEVMERASAKLRGYRIKASWKFLLEGDAHCGETAGCPLCERRKGLWQPKNTTLTTTATLPWFTLVGYNNPS